MKKKNSRDSLNIFSPLYKLKFAILLNRYIVEFIWTNKKIEKKKEIAIFTLVHQRAQEKWERRKILMKIHVKEIKFLE